MGVSVPGATPAGRFVVQVLRFATDSEGLTFITPFNLFRLKAVLQTWSPANIFRLKAVLQTWSPASFFRLKAVLLTTAP